MYNPKEHTPEENRSYAKEVVLTFASEQVDKTEEGKAFRANRSIIQVRKHFDTLHADAAAAALGVSFQSVIDDLIKSRQLLVTNGFVWVNPHRKGNSDGKQEATNQQEEPVPATTEGEAST